MLKIAYCGLPHTGGTYTVYRMLRQGLINYDIDLRWVNLAKPDFVLPDHYLSEIEFGDLIQIQENDRQTTKAFIEHIQKNYDGIIFNVVSNKIQTNAARYLSNEIIKLQIVHNITPATYRAANSICDYVHASIGVSPRIEKDLVTSMGCVKNRTQTIPNGVNLSAFHKNSSQKFDNGPLKLLFLGRIEDAAKGVFWLPEILQACLNRGIKVTLGIAGDGRDFLKLKQKIHQMGLETHTQFYGKVDYTNVPQILSQHHVLLMPSRYEGLPLSLVESMASGCVPVCSHIKGVTDFIISSGKNGYLFPVGDVQTASKLIGKLEDKNHWEDLSNNAKKCSQSRFSLEQQSESYANLIYQLKANLPQLKPPLTLEKWSMASGLQPSLSVYLPDNIKNMLRVFRERLQN